MPDGDYRPRGNSPAVGRGHETVLEHTEQDLDGNPRARDGGVLDGGAYAVNTRGVLGFVKPSFVVTEDQPEATVQVERRGGFSGRISATLRTRDASAVAGEHYQGVVAEVVFNNGQGGTREIAVPVIAHDGAQRGHLPDRRERTETAVSSGKGLLLRYRFTGECE